MVTPEQVDRWRQAPFEQPGLEFKEARNNYDRGRLAAYCVAIANEGGGHMLLGIADRPPRRVVGSDAFRKAQLALRMHHLDQHCSSMLRNDPAPKGKFNKIVFNSTSWGRFPRDRAGLPTAAHTERELSLSKYKPDSPMVVRENRIPGRHSGSGSSGRSRRRFRDPFETTRNGLASRWPVSHAGGRSARTHV